MALVAAVALHQTLTEFCAAEQALAQRLLIKWPNDLLADGAKLAGILLERAGDAVVIGFGANLAHHPSGLERAVTDLAALTGLAIDPEIAAEALARAFAHWLARWRRDGIEPIRSAWLAGAHPLGTRLTTSCGDGAFAGLDQSGALILNADDGSRLLIHAGDVFLV